MSLITYIISLVEISVSPKTSVTSRLSILQIAQKAGVSSATVSRAFNRPELLRPDTLKHVQIIASQLGFRPNLVGRSLRQGATHTIGLMLPTLTNPVFADCFEGACRQAQLSGYSLMMATTNYQDDEEHASLQNLVDHRVDGLVLALGSTLNHDTVGLLDDSGIPFTLVYSQMQGAPAVSIDDLQAGQDIMELVLAFGHRRVHFVSGPIATSDRAKRRLLGLRAAVRRNGNATLCHAVMRQHTACEVALVEKMLEASPSVAICSNDMLALSLIASCRSLGVAVPTQLSVCGFDGIQFGAMNNPPLTTVAQPSRDMGRLACKTLIDHLAHGVPMNSHLIPHHIFEGDTVSIISPTSVEGPIRS